MSVNIPNSMLKLGTLEFKIKIADLPSRMKIKFLREINSGVIFSNGNLSKLAATFRNDRKLPTIHFRGGHYCYLSWHNLPRDSVAWTELDKLPAIVALMDSPKKDSYRKHYQEKEEEALRERFPDATCTYLAIGATDLYKHLDAVGFPPTDVTEDSTITLNQYYF